MMYASFVFVLFNVASVVPVVDVTLITTRKPFGVRMCEELCNKYKCGSCFEYDVSTLTCDIYDNETAPNVTQNAPSDKGVTDQQEKEQTHTGVFKRITTTDINKDSGIVDHNKRTWSRLLVVPYLTSKAQDFNVYSFVDKSFKKYRYIQVKRVSCIIYIPSVKSIWISSDREILCHKVNNRYQGTVTRLYDSKVHSMVVDDTRGVVFVSRDKFGLSKIIEKFTTIGKYLSKYTVDTKKPFFITNDRNRQILFYNDHKQIRVTDYKLEHHDGVISCNSCHVIAYDTMNKTLFYKTGTGGIMKLKDGRSDIVTQTDPRSLTFVYRHRHEILYTLKRKPVIFSLDSKTGQNKILMNKTTKSKSHGLLICALN